ncbi:PAAR domain-containing protein [Telluria sp. B2]
MTYRRYHIRGGATTTAGGTVSASSQSCIVDGKPLAREGDPVACPACNTQGHIECVMPRISDTFAGKEYALSDDLCICECSPPPRLVADQDIKFQALDASGKAV